MIDLSRAIWRKSSRSSDGGGNCVEVAVLGGLTWRKSSRSSGGNGACVEAAVLPDRCVAVRDSKDPAGPVLVFAPARWTALLAGARHGHLGRP